MTISALAAATNTTTTSTSATSATNSATTAQNTFLTLLTTELKNQNPVSPTDTAQFTSQLIGMAGVEQQMQTNDLLTTMSATLSKLYA